MTQWKVLSMSFFPLVPNVASKQNLVMSYKLLVVKAEGIVLRSLSEQF